MKNIFAIILLLPAPLSIYGEIKGNDKNFIRFHYNNEEFFFSEETESGSNSVWFIETNKEYIIVHNAGEMNYIFKIILSKPADKTQTYLIYNSHREKPISDVWIKFADDSSIKNYKTKKVKIGECKLSEITDIKLSGTFNCELEKGIITDGEFSVIKFIPYKTK